MPPSSQVYLPRLLTPAATPGHRPAGSCIPGHPGRKTRNLVPQSSAPESSPRPFDFAELGRPRAKAPPSVRAVSFVPVAEASGDLDELGADDILESDDIDSLEAAAAGITSFEAPPSEPSGFEVGELGAFDEVEVEGLVPAIPAAPATSPLPLESMMTDDAFPERTLEIRRDEMSSVAAAAAALDAREPQQTEVLKRSDMPFPAAAPAWPSHPQGASGHARRPGSIAPVALDVAAAPRATMPSFSAHAPGTSLPAHAARHEKKGLSGLAIGGIVLAAVAFVGLVGIGGFTASRALSDKPEAVSIAPSHATAGEAATSAARAAGAPGEPRGSAASALPSDPAAPATLPGPATLDVSALPSVPAPVAAPRAFTGSGSGGSAHAAPGHGSTASGIRTTALPPPGAAPAPTGPTALPPPVAAPAAAPAPAPVQSTTGIVRVDPTLRAVVVDGAYRRASDGVVTVSCGTHRIKAGMKEAQTVNVPCGGSVSL